MDKASVFGTEDCRFESYRGQDFSTGRSLFCFVQNNFKFLCRPAARLAQLVERQPFKLVVVGSSPTVGAFAGKRFNCRDALEIVCKINTHRHNGAMAQR